MEQAQGLEQIELDKEEIEALFDDIAELVPAGDELPGLIAKCRARNELETLHAGAVAMTGIVLSLQVHPSEDFEPAIKNVVARSGGFATPDLHRLCARLMREGALHPLSALRQALRVEAVPDELVARRVEGVLGAYAR